ASRLSTPAMMSDHRLGREARHRGAADVLNRSGHIVADRLRQGFAFFLKQLRPGRVVGHDVNLSVGRLRVSAPTSEPLPCTETPRGLQCGLRVNRPGRPEGLRYVESFVFSCSCFSWPWSLCGLLRAPRSTVVIGISASPCSSS